MTVADLKRILNKYPDDMEVLTKKTDVLGNVGYINSVKADTYGFFGWDESCLLLTDEYEQQAESEE